MYTDCEPPIMTQECLLHKYLDQASEKICVEHVKTLFQEIPKEQLTIKDDNGYTFLHKCCIFKHMDNVIDVLFERLTDDDLLIQSTRGLTPVHMACSSANQHALEKFLERLSKEQFMISDKFGYTPLHFAQDDCYIQNGPNGPNLSGLITEKYSL